MTTVKLTCNKFIGGLVLWEHENVDMSIDACDTHIQWKSKKFVHNKHNQKHRENYNNR